MEEGKRDGGTESERKSEKESLRYEVPRLWYWKKRGWLHSGWRLVTDPSVIRELFL